MTEIYRGDHRAGEIELLEEIEVFHNPFFTLYNDRVRFPNGQQGHYIRKRSGGGLYGVCIMPVDRQGNLLLIRQFRHCSRRWMWEIPKGFGEHHLSALENAKKELKEETGYTSDEWEHLLTWKGESEQGSYLFRAILEDSGRGAQALEGTEAIAEVTWFTPEKLRALLTSGERLDEETTFCIMYCLQAEAPLWH